MKNLLIAIVLVATPFIAEARQVIKECEITPAIWQLAKVPEAPTTNNLRRKVGSSEFAHGNWITVYGRVVDANCVPISDAIVEIWHANAYGGIDYDESIKKARKDPNFLGAGSTTTDNEGNYSFLTIFPGSTTKKNAPKINIRVRHRDFLPLETLFFFENHTMNFSDIKLNTEISKHKRDLLVAKQEKCITNSQEDDIKYRFNITLEGKNLYRKY